MTGIRFATTLVPQAIHFAARVGAATQALPASVFLAVTLAVIVAGASGSSAATVPVPAGNNWYCDPSYQDGVCDTTIAVGDTVVWEMAAGTHTVTECEPGFANCPPSGGFDSGLLNQGESSAHTFSQAGVYEYLCLLHDQQMRGRITAEQATPGPTSTATPPPPTPTPVPPGDFDYAFSAILNTGKLKSVGNENVLLTERGTSFGYNRLVSDFRAIPIMQGLGCPVVFDATHIVRLYGIPSSDPRGGEPQYVPMLVKAGVAAGANALFLETHFNPAQAWCDAASMIPLDVLEPLMEQAAELHAVAAKWNGS